jgi:hypothetical protein
MGGQPSALADTMVDASAIAANATLKRILRTMSLVLLWHRRWGVERVPRLPSDSQQMRPSRDRHKHVTDC